MTVKEVMEDYRENYSRRRAEFDEADLHFYLMAVKRRVLAQFALEFAVALPEDYGEDA